jgi:hypothetical protein
MTRKNNYLEHLQRRREQAARAEQNAAPKDPAEMSDEELDEAITESKRALLDAQRAELRVRDQEPEREEGRRSFAEFIKRRPYYR